MEGSGRFVPLVAIILAALLLEETIVVMAAKHVVGGSSGWDESTDFNTWASGETFKVGDELEFKYSAGLHSVVELGDESAFKGCDIGSALKSYNGGSDTVKLTKTGTRYFACGTSGHCGQGMKVKITTVAADAPPSSSSSSSSSGSRSGSGTTTPPSSTSASSPRFQFLGFFATLIASLSAFLLVLFV